MLFGISKSDFTALIINPRTKNKMAGESIFSNKVLEKIKTSDKLKIPNPY